MIILPYLLKIIEKYTLFGKIETSTTRLAQILDLSQQSVSRILIQLEQGDYIHRNSSVKGIELEFRERSFRLLKHTYNLLHKYFSDFQIEGEVTKGIGEGRYYVKLPGYRNRFKEKLEIKPFPGTLNLRVDKSKVKAVKLFFEPVRIEGFQTGDRTFGYLDCYKCIINDKFEGWVLFAERTTHADDIIEVISEEEIKSPNNKVNVTFVKNCQ